MNKSDCIVFDNVSISYGSEQAVRNVSFSVPTGEVFAIVGESGSGKSTLVRAAFGMLKQASISGQILLNGTDGFDMVERAVVTMSTNDPYWYLSLFYKTGAKANVGGYSNPQVDALIDQLSVTFDQNARANEAKQAQQLLVDDVADIYLMYPSATVVSTTKVKNVPVHPIDYYLLTKDSTIE